jgi:hypothetical protein
VQNARQEDEPRRHRSYLHPVEHRRLIEIALDARAVAGCAEARSAGASTAMAKLKHNVTRRITIAPGKAAVAARNGETLPRSDVTVA